MIGISRATYYHKPSRKERQLADDLELRDVIDNIHLELPGYVYIRIHETGNQLKRRRFEI
jgi:hypothetical protein